MMLPLQRLLSRFSTRAQQHAGDNFTGDTHNTAFACEIRSYAEYEAGYHRLAAAVDRPERTPSPGELARIRELIDRRTNPAGSLGIADCLFLGAFVSIIRPRRMVEIGTGSGFSSALLASVIQFQMPHIDAPYVHTLDVQTRYFGNSELPVGFEISNLISEFPELVRVHAPAESSLIGTLAGKGELELAFIDGNHQHPCALLDLLRVAPYMQSSGWILLHDIRLGTFVEESRKTNAPLPFEPVFGAEWLFNDWPWRKIDGGNIGAIQLPGKRKALVPLSGKLMKRPLEVCRESYRRLHREVSEAAGVCGR